MERSIFFNRVRSSLFSGKLTQSQAGEITSTELIDAYAWPGADGMMRAIIIAAILFGLSACSKPDPYHWGHIAEGVGKISGKESPLAGSCPTRGQRAPLSR